MKRQSASHYFAYALILTLVGSIFSIALPAFQPSHASHENIQTVELDGMFYGQGDDVVITGSIDDVVDDEDVEITVTDPTNDGDSDDVTPDEDDGYFDFVYTIDSNADDGVYEVEVQYDGDTVFSYFIVDEEDDAIVVETSDDVYQAGDTVEIEGLVEDVESEEEVEITVIDPTGEELLNEKVVALDDDEFTYDDLDLENDAPHGRYAVIVSYDGIEGGWFIFEVEDEDAGSNDDDDVEFEGDSGSDGDITAGIVESSYAPDDTVTVSGSIDNYDDTEEVGIIVTNPDDDEIESDDDVTVASDGDFEFEFDLADDAEEGEYLVVITYDSDELELTFDVDEDAGTGSPSSSGLTAKLNKASYLAGETMTVTGKVPRVVSEETVSIVILEPNGIFSGSAAYPEPVSGGSFTASLRLPSDLKDEEGYRVVVSYDRKEVELLFAVTGKAPGALDGPLTVDTDKPEYSAGSAVRIFGGVSPDDMVAGQQVLIQVYNPENAAYRFDLVTPEDDGSYSYSMTVGGELGISGEYEVTATYNQEQVSTTFDITGGLQSTKYNLRVQDDTYPIEYEITGGQISNMFINTDSKKLVVAINAEEDGRLVLVLPRNVIDSAEGGSDKAYVVATTDLQAGAAGTIDVSESDPSDETRTIVIDYEAGTDLIEISGTSVVPEFPVTAIVLAVAIVGIIAATAKFSRFGSSNLLPRN